MGIYLIMSFACRRFILDSQAIDHYPYALVLGAGLEKNGTPSDILMDRVLTAVNLYQSKKVDLLIMSGTRRKGYDEPGAMRAAALTAGVPSSAIRTDPDGISTFNSCINLVQTYAPESVLIVTQQFHLPRAILLQRALGVNASGVAAHLYCFSWRKKAFWYAREVIALPFNCIKLAIYLYKN